MSNKKYTMKNGKAVKVSEEIYKYLVKSDRRIRYIEEDLKSNTYIIDSVNEKVTVIPKREQSLDKLMEIGMDFSDGMMDFQDNAILKISLEQAMSNLSDEERYLITQIFYFGRTERSLAEELDISQYTVNRNKHKILKKLKEEISA